MEEKRIDDLLAYKTLKMTVSAMLGAGRDPVEIAVALNALSIEVVSERLEPIR